MMNFTKLGSQARVIVLLRDGSGEWSSMMMVGGKEEAAVAALKQHMNVLCPAVTHVVSVILLF